MKSLDEIIKNRKSVRKYLNKPVEKEKIMQMLEAARLAPSACNAQPWKFVVVANAELKEDIFNEGLNNLIVTNKWADSAPVIIVVCSQTKFIVHNVAEKIQDVNYHLIDLGIACEHLVLKAEELGLGTCYIGWFRGKEIKKILNLPFSYKIECLITLGYGDEPVQKEAVRKSLEEIAEFK
ncbi:MAG: nitroreductase family protein [Endomicrobium sp.]|jgi:nitroreductase|nr:nitroreductase family protein [Endomicrobium sp.]